MKLTGNIEILFLTEKETWNLPQERFNSINHDPHIILDVYDGEGYTKHKEFLSHPANISLLLNTDGVAVFRSSKATLWPVRIVVNELPKCKRYRCMYIVCTMSLYSMDACQH